MIRQISIASEKNQKIIHEIFGPSLQFQNFLTLLLLLSSFFPSGYQLRPQFVPNIILIDFMTIKQTFYPVLIFLFLILIKTEIIPLGGFRPQNIEDMKDDELFLMAQKAAKQFVKEEWNTTLCKLDKVFYRTTGAANFVLYYNSTVGDLQLNVFVIPWMQPNTLTKGEIIKEYELEECPKEEKKKQVPAIDVSSNSASSGV